MSILVDHQIEEWCKGNGLLIPYDAEMLNPASIDVRIGDSALIESSCEKGPKWLELDLTKYSESKPYMMAPKQFLLVATLETMNIPDHCCAEFRIKSSRAREGYNNLLAVWIDPGFNNSKLTLELVNECYFHHLPLYPGLRIGQLVLHTTSSDPVKSYKLTGRYNDSEKVYASKG